ncbi:protein transport [Halocaridina rubra]|uniref:Protein transport n=1 Tax=Halocaridina rubra TaxID=373956 RepID=A0AAN9A1G2_HALRR
MNPNSVVTPNVDLSKVEAINQKRTLAFINHWILHTVGFLNQFSSLCEEKLISLDTKLRRANHSLSILEAKLNSVPDLEGVVASNAKTTESSEIGSSTSASNSQQAGSDTQNTASVSAAPNTNGASSETDGQEKVQPDGDMAKAVTTTPVSKDPRFAQYFKMLAVGVPEPAIKMKMSSEGLDPSILDDPNAPAPPVADDDNADTQMDNSDSSSVSSWSD